MPDVVLSLGCNLGDRASAMRRMELEAAQLLTPPIVKSSLMETEPVGTVSEQAWFYNRLVRGGYDGTPRELLKACLSIENKLGRKRPLSNGYAPRTADIDILLFGGEVIKEADLVIPHPGIPMRKFCVMGLKEIAGAWIFPGNVKRIDELAGEWERGLGMQGVKLID